MHVCTRQWMVEHTWWVEHWHWHIRPGTAGPGDPRLLATMAQLQYNRATWQLSISSDTVNIIGQVSGDHGSPHQRGSGGLHPHGQDQHGGVRQEFENKVRPWLRLDSKHFSYEWVNYSSACNVKHNEGFLIYMIIRFLCNEVTRQKLYVWLWILLLRHWDNSQRQRLEWIWVEHKIEQL